MQCHAGQRSFKAIAEWPLGCQKWQEPLAVRKWCKGLVPSRWVNCNVIPLWLYASTRVLVRQRKRTNSIWAERERGRERDWFSVIGSQDYGGCQVQNLQICRVGQQAEDSGNSSGSSSSPKALCWLQNSFLLGGRSVFVLLRLSADWMRPTSILDDNLIYSKPADLNVNLTQETLSQKHLEVFDHISGNYGPVKLIHKINYHKTSPCQFGPKCISLNLT